MRYVVRMWEHPDGWEGDGWKYKTVAKFEALMRTAARKRRGLPALVQSWDDGRCVLCWYEARVGAEEKALRERCRNLFGKLHSGHPRDAHRDREPPPRGSGAPRGPRRGGRR